MYFLKNTLTGPLSLLTTLLLRLHESAYTLSTWKKYRVANKFSDTLNELFVVNCLISKKIVEIQDEN